MGKQKVTYKQVLEKLAVSAKTNKVVVCTFCGELMHIVHVNPLVAFWVHKGEDVQKCAERNVRYPGRPMIKQNMNFYRQMKSIWMGIQEAKKRREEKKDGGSSKD